MMKKSGALLLAATLMLFPLVPGASAQEDPDNDNSVTQGELARMLVNVLGLHRFLPPAPSAHEAIALLVVNGIAPADGWQPDHVVTRADLARIIVLSLDRGEEVEDPDMPQSWVDFLVENGIPIDTVGVALEGVGPLGDPIAPGLLAESTSTDPLTRRAIFGQPDEHAMGTEMMYVVSMKELVDLIAVAVVVVPPPRIPVTPD